MRERNEDGESRDEIRTLNLKTGDNKTRQITRFFEFRDEFSAKISIYGRIEKVMMIGSRDEIRELRENDP